jgi:gas vesicle protein
MGNKVKKSLKLLTGVIMGTAIGSILGFTLAPKKGKETREYLREKSMEMFLKGKKMITDQPKCGPCKKIINKFFKSK